MLKFQVDLTKSYRIYRCEYAKSNLIATESNRVIIRDARPTDSGNYRCVAKNDYSTAHAAEVISIDGN